MRALTLALSVAACGARTDLDDLSGSGGGGAAASGPGGSASSGTTQPACDPGEDAVALASGLT